MSKIHDATKELEQRMDTINKAAATVFDTGGVSTLLRNLSIKVTPSTLIHVIHSKSNYISGSASNH